MLALSASMSAESFYEDESRIICRECRTAFFANSLEPVLPRLNLHEKSSARMHYADDEELG